jgi:hypothetical protein
LAFAKGGGIVIAMESLPMASEKVGSCDAKLDAMVESLFGFSASKATGLKAVRTCKVGDGVGHFSSDSQETRNFIKASFVQDFEGQGFVLHRKVGQRDIYLVAAGKEGAECFFRCKGGVEIWNPWTGSVKSFYDFSQDDNGTRLRLPRECVSGSLIVFGPGRAELVMAEHDVDEIVQIAKTDGKVSARGFVLKGGAKKGIANACGELFELSGRAGEPAPTIELDGLWDFELKPTMDNRWGDFRIPASNDVIGPEARRLHMTPDISKMPGWMAASTDNDRWEHVTCGFGAKFVEIMLPEVADGSDYEASLAAIRAVDLKGASRNCWCEARVEALQFLLAVRYRE